MQLFEDAVFSGPVTFNNESGFRFDSTAEFQSDFIVNSAYLFPARPESQLIINGDITPGDVSILASNEATISIPWITSMGANNPALKLEATGENSSITLPNLETLTPPVPGQGNTGNAMELIARFGGTVNLPSLTTINRGRVRLIVNNEGSSLQLPAIQKIEGPEEGLTARVDVKNSGQLVAGPITSLDFTDLELDETVDYPITDLTSMTNGLLEIDAFKPDLSNLDTIENLSLTVFGGGVIEFPGITSITLDRNEWKADGESSAIRFPDLTQITGAQTTSGATLLRALRGGRVELPALTTLDGYFQIRSTNDNSVVDLSALIALTSIQDRLSLLEATSGGTINLADTVLTGGDVSTTETGTLSGNTITTATGSEVTGPGTLSSSLTNQALIKLDRDTGPIVVEGNLILDTDSRIEVTVGLGSEFTGSGKLEVTGAATLGGTIEIIQRGSYSPQVGDQFEIITYSSKSADFQTLEGLALKNDLVGELEITDTSVTLKVVAP